MSTYRNTLQTFNEYIQFSRMMRKRRANMSNREKLANLTKDLTEAQLASVVAIVEAHLTALDEALDDAFCLQLLKEAHADPDDEPMDFDEFVAQVRAGRA